MNALAWMAELSTAGRREGTAARAATVRKVAVVDRWNGTGWTELRLVWDGTAYVEDAEDDIEQAREDAVTGQFVLDWLTGTLAVSAIMLSAIVIIGTVAHRWRVHRQRRRVAQAVSIIRKHYGMDEGRTR